MDNSATQVSKQNLKLAWSNGQIVQGPLDHCKECHVPGISFSLGSKIEKYGIYQIELPGFGN